MAIGVAAVLLYEAARAYYRPYVGTHGIEDFHLADTIGNSLGTVATVFVFVSLLGRDFRQGIFLVRTVTISLLVYEFAHPVLGKRIDAWDLLATLISGVLCELVYRAMHGKLERAAG